MVSDLIRITGCRIYNSLMLVGLLIYENAQNIQDSFNNLAQHLHKTSTQTNYPEAVILFIAKREGGRELSFSESEGVGSPAGAGPSPPKPNET